jgi:two-component sensor histidine kinase
LIVNELVSNSLKYAFPEGASGSIQVACKETQPGEYQLIVRDDGVGLPPEFDLTQLNSLGLKLVSNLSEQLSGSFTAENEGGAVCKVTFRRMHEDRQNGS